MLNNQEKEITLIKDLGLIYAKETSKQKRRYGLFKCHCGNEFKSIAYNINSGSTKSCGCSIENRGIKENRLYKVWKGMKDRCYNKNLSYYKNYGGRGIKICDRWLNISNFIEDMQPTFEEGLTLDRKDNNGNYEPSNCRWETRIVQARNTRILKSNNKSGYRGVSFNSARKKWICFIRINKKLKYLGSFDNKFEAAVFYDNYVVSNNLEHTINGVLS